MYKYHLIWNGRYVDIIIKLVIFGLLFKVLIWTPLSLSACAFWADILGWSCLSMSSSKSLEPFWLQPPWACSTMVRQKLWSLKTESFYLPGTLNTQAVCLGGLEAETWKVQQEQRARGFLIQIWGKFRVEIKVWQYLDMFIVCVFGGLLLFCTCGEMLADAIRSYSGGELTVTGPTATAGIFSTYPADYLSLWGGVVDQVRPRQPCLNIQQLKDFLTWMLFVEFYWTSCAKLPQNSQACVNMDIIKPIIMNSPTTVHPLMQTECTKY